MNIIIVAEGAIDREGNAITPHAVKEVIPSSPTTILATIIIITIIITTIIATIIITIIIR